MLTWQHAQYVLDLINTAVLTCDDDLVLKVMNPAAEIMFGVSNKQMIGKPVQCLMGSGEGALADLLRKALTSGHAITAHDMTLTLSDGQTVTTDLTATPVTSPDYDDRLLVELVQVDRFLRLAREENRVDRQLANRAVMRGLAHEIKNPLGGLRGAAQLLDRELGDDEQREYTRIIIHEADRLRNLVDRMTGPSQPIEHQMINIHEVLEHVRLLILAEDRKLVQIERDYDPSLPPVKGDRGQLIQAVLNIARNAIEAIEGNGTIRIRTRVERSVYIDQRWHRQAARIDLVDNGPGVPETLKDHIFYPMVTGRAEGSGLGLSIAQDIMHQHGGLIELESRPGDTRFTLMLPFYDQRQNDE